MTGFCEMHWAGGLLQVAVLAAWLQASTGQGPSVSACVGSNRENCIDMEACTVNIDGSIYDLSSLQQAGGHTADAGSGASHTSREPHS